MIIRYFEGKLPGGFSFVGCTKNLPADLQQKSYSDKFDWFAHI